MSGNKKNNGVHEVGTTEITAAYKGDTPGQTVDEYLKLAAAKNVEKKKERSKNFSQVFDNPLKGFPYNEDFTVRDVNEEVEAFMEGMDFWKVTVTKSINKLKKGRSVIVKARNSSEALKKGAKNMGDPKANMSGYMVAVKDTKFPTNTSATQGKRMGESDEIDESSEAWVLVQNRKIIKKFKRKPSNSAFTSSDNQTLMTVSKAAKMGIKESVELDESMGKLNAKGEIEMTAKNYAKVHKDYKTKMQGVPYAMQIDPKTGGSALYPVKIIKEGKVTMKENAVTHAKHGYGEILQRTDEGVDVMFEHGVEMGMDESELIGILEKSATGSQKQAKNVPGAGGEKHGETASAGEKAFAKGLGKDGESVGTEEEDGVDDINKASRVKGQAPTRGGEPRIGDKAIVKPVTDPAKGK